MNANLMKLSNFQAKPLGKTEVSIKTLDDIKLPIFVEGFLSYDPKYPIKDTFQFISWQY